MLGTLMVIAGKLYSGTWTIRVLHGSLAPMGRTRITRPDVRGERSAHPDQGGGGMLTTSTRGAQLRFLHLSPWKSAEAWHQVISQHHESTSGLEVDRPYTFRRTHTKLKSRQTFISFPAVNCVSCVWFLQQC